MSTLIAVLDEIRTRRRLLNEQLEVLDIWREDAVYRICEQIVEQALLPTPNTTSNQRSE